MLARAGVLSEKWLDRGGAGLLPCEPGFPVCGPVPGGPAVPRGSAERSPKGLPH